MGVYDTFFSKDGGEIQLKAGLCILADYRVGDAVPDMKDGIYFDHDYGYAVIADGVVAEVEMGTEVCGECWGHLPRFDKWGASK